MSKKAQRYSRILTERLNLVHNHLLRFDGVLCSRFAFRRKEQYSPRGRKFTILRSKSPPQYQLQAHSRSCMHKYNLRHFSDNLGLRTQRNENINMRISNKQHCVIIRKYTQIILSIVKQTTALLTSRRSACIYKYKSDTSLTLNIFLTTAALNSNRPV